METEEKKLKATVSEYKGNPVISLPLGNNERYSFTFGLTKAKAVLEYLDDIKKFVEAEDAKTEETKTEETKTEEKSE